MHGIFGDLNIKASASSRGLSQGRQKRTRMEVATMVITIGSFLPKFLEAAIPARVNEKIILERHRMEPEDVVDLLSHTVNHHSRAHFCVVLTDLLGFTPPNQ